MNYKIMWDVSIAYVILDSDEGKSKVISQLLF